MTDPFNNWGTGELPDYRFSDEDLGLSEPNQSTLWNLPACGSHHASRADPQPSASAYRGSQIQVDTDGNLRAAVRGGKFPISGGITDTADEPEPEKRPDPVILGYDEGALLVQCPACGDVLKGMRGYNRHYRDGHFREDIFACFACSNMVQYDTGRARLSRPLLCCCCEDRSVYLGPGEVIEHFKQYHFHYLWSHKMKYLRRLEEVNAEKGHLRKSRQDAIHEYISRQVRSNKKHFFMVKNFRGHKFCDHCDICFRDLAHLVQHRKCMDDRKEKPSPRMNDTFTLRIRNHLKSEIMTGPWTSLLLNLNLPRDYEDQLNWHWNGERASSLLRDLEADLIDGQDNRSVLAQRAFELHTGYRRAQAPPFNSGLELDSRFERQRHTSQRLGMQLFEASQHPNPGHHCFQPRYLSNAEQSQTQQQISNHQNTSAQVQDSQPVSWVNDPGSGGIMAQSSGQGNFSEFPNREQNQWNAHQQDSSDQYWANFERGRDYGTGHR